MAVPAIETLRAMSRETRQAATIAFLKRQFIEPVEEQRTHISVILLGGERVWKLKRAVALPYVDFSDPAVRWKDCERELALNRRTAPTLYRRALRITRSPGGLEFDGSGELVDGVVEMGRFPQEDLFAEMAASGRLTDDLATRLATVIAEFHASLAPIVDDHASLRVAEVLTGVRTCLRSHADALGPALVEAYCEGSARALSAAASRLDARGKAGAVALAHGDLHLGNICLWDGVPTLFDCLEFDDALATVDRTYDLAFLLMDLWRRDRRSTANLLVNRYLDEIPDEADLALSPFLMSVRAAIRAHVHATQSSTEDARGFLDLAARLLEPAPPILVALGGFSGSGKSTVAAALADRVGAPPGARVIGTDRIRKAFFGVPPDQRLPAEAYRQETTDAIYAQLAARAEAILRNGWSVVAEATFSTERERARIERCAEAAGVRFLGIWLDAEPATLRSRLAQRRGDVSDADANVLEGQLRRGAGPISWVRINAEDDLQQIIRAVRLPSR